ncbi:MAG: hydroxyphenylacetyl-CoA thioesterase PaaI [Alphaproteobacteria bacterium]|nr:hydroxyphenylacetyl-CoA thioesterase PaaI [Alphaproteobacteria bacterium]
MAAPDDQAAKDRTALLHAGDRAAAALGIRLLDSGPGRAKIAMTVREDMSNFHGTLHGGVVFLLADTAFGLACNNRGPTTVALAAEIRFAAAPRPGDELIADCAERLGGGRTSVYDTTVTRVADGATVALFRGHGYRVGTATRE